MAKMFHAPANEDPRNMPEFLRDVAADWRRTAEWAMAEARDDSTHPNDAARFEDEAGMWSIAVREIEKAAAEIERVFLSAEQSGRTPSPASLGEAA
jgi:hypothetical protein